MSFLTRSVILFAALCLTRTIVAQTPGTTMTKAQQQLAEADSTTTFLVTLKDKSTFAGRVRQVRNDSLVFVATAGILTLAIADVRKVTVVRDEDLVNGEYWFPNPNKTRLLFGPTGRMLDKGTGYFSVYELFLPGVAYGATNNFTVGGGISFVPGVNPADQLLYATPKVGVIRSDNVNVAVGALAMRASESDTFGILFGVGTFGGVNSSITAGVGFGYIGTEVSESPLLMIGGEHRMTGRVGIVSENYFVPGEFDGGLMMLGLRFFGESMAFDAGIIRPFDEGDSITLPYVGFVVNF